VLRDPCFLVDPSFEACGMSVTATISLTHPVENCTDMPPSKHKICFIYSCMPSPHFDCTANATTTPADTYLELLESSLCSALLGLSSTTPGGPHSLLLTDSGLSSLHDPVLMTPGHPGGLMQRWLKQAKSSSSAGGSDLQLQLQFSSGIRGGAEKVLLRCLRVAAHLAGTNWRLWLQQGIAAPQQQQQEQEQQQDSGAAGAVASSSDAGGGAEAPQQAASAPSLQLPAPLVFSEWLAAVVSGSYNPDLLYQQQQQGGAAVAAFGSATAALLPLLCARLGLLLCCLVLDLAVLHTAESAAGASLFRRGREPTQTHTLLRLSLVVAKQVLQLAVDLAQAQQEREAAAAAATTAAGASTAADASATQEAAQEAAESGADAGQPGSETDGSQQQAEQQGGKQQQTQEDAHWLAPGLQAMLKVVNLLLAGASSSSASKSKSKAVKDISMPVTRFSEALLSLSHPLGVKIIQLSAEARDTGGMDKEFTGFSSRHKSQMAKHDKALASTVISVSQVRMPRGPEVSVSLSAKQLPAGFLYPDIFHVSADGCSL